MDDETKNDNTDDGFQQNPGETNPLEVMKQHEKLPEDNDTPFSPPDGVQDRIEDTFQPTDTNMDKTQWYDGGVEDAAGVDMPGEAADEDDEVPATQ